MHIVFSIYYTLLFIYTHLTPLIKVAVTGSIKTSKPHHAQTHNINITTVVVKPKNSLFM